MAPLLSNSKATNVYVISYAWAESQCWEPDDNENSNNNNNSNDKKEIVL